MAMTTKTIPPLDVAAIRARADAAAPDEWLIGGTATRPELGRHPNGDKSRWNVIADLCTDFATMMFIREARAAVPALCDALESALAEVALLRAVVDALPRCNCGATATWRDIRGGHLCDTCWGPNPKGLMMRGLVELPHAAALRILLAGGAR